ncbi:hypothetical protein [Catenuloplanes sp. NPDC020197]|uniref:hypothetical protein n=1 Tax=Catenuloplanes sp. NPDC020197 TaxID=3363958 RepID=UPI003789FD57
MSVDLRDFLALSSRLTGFTPAELLATGFAEHCHAVVLERAGASRLGALSAVTVPPDPDALDLARAIARVWYTGVWSAGDEAPFVVSRRAYAEGLVWKTFGGAPPGTVGPGFGSWAAAPRVRAAAA